MQTRIFSLLVLAAFFLGCAAIAPAQNPANDWSSLQKISPGTDLIIEPKTGKTIKASLEKRGDTEIVVFSKKNLLTISKDSIKRIYLARTKPVKKAKNIGAGIGLLLGYAAAVAAYSDTDAQTAMGGVPIVLAGAGIGYLLGKMWAKGKRKGQLIYEAS